MSVKDDFRQADDLIMGILENNPIARGSDIELVLAVWAAQGVELDSFQLQTIRLAMSPETIRRTRQKLNEKGLYLPSETIQSGRRKLQEEHRTYHKEEKQIVTEPEPIKEEKIVGYKDVTVSGKTYHLPVYA